VRKVHLTGGVVESLGDLISGVDVHGEDDELDWLVRVCEVLFSEGDGIIDFRL